MEFIIAMFFGLVVGTATFGTKTQSECKDKYNYEPKACKPAKALEELGKIGE